MIDELHELRRANPHRREELAPQVAMSTDQFLDAVRADTHRFPWLAAARPSRGRRSAAQGLGRLAWSAALACVVAVLVIAAHPMGIDDTGPAERGVSATLDDDAGPDTTAPNADVPDTAGPPPTAEDVPAQANDPVEVIAEVDEQASPPGGVDVADPAPVEPPVAAIPSTSAPAPAPTIATPPSTPSTASPDPTTTEPVGLFDPAVDLLVLHLDFAHTDDALAALAAEAVAAHYGVDALAVAGTADPGGAYAHPHASVMNAVWGSTWVDASTDRAAALELAAQRWIGALDAGGDVWIAEGGVSDFTAEVVASVRTARPDIQTSSRVHVVQHAQRNYDETVAAARSEVVSTTDYVWIDDGNSLNGTADLAQTSSAFVTAALDGPSAEAWSVGFAQHSADGLDFSDTVAVLHIFGVGIDRVANPTDFADLFLP